MDSATKQAEDYNVLKSLDKVFKEFLSPREEKIIRMRFGICPTTSEVVVRLYRYNKQNQKISLDQEIGRLGLHQNTVIEKCFYLSNLLDEEIKKYTTPQLLEFMSAEFDLSKERIRQIETNVIRKFRNNPQYSDIRILKHFIK